MRGGADRVRLRCGHWHLIPDGFTVDDCRERMACSTCGEPPNWTPFDSPDAEDIAYPPTERPEYGSASTPSTASSPDGPYAGDHFTITPSEPTRIPIQRMTEMQDEINEERYLDLIGKTERLHTGGATRPHTDLRAINGFLVTAVRELDKLPVGDPHIEKAHRAISLAGCCIDVRDLNG